MWVDFLEASKDFVGTFLFNACHDVRPYEMQLLGETGEEEKKN